MSEPSFEEWLGGWLRNLKTDDAVFGPYITSILEGDEEEEDKLEALDGLLMELGVSTHAWSMAHHSPKNMHIHISLQITLLIPYIVWTVTV